MCVHQRGSGLCPGSSGQTGRRTEPERVTLGETEEDKSPGNACVLRGHETKGWSWHLGHIRNRSKITTLLIVGQYLNPVLFEDTPKLSPLLLLRMLFSHTHWLTNHLTASTQGLHLAKSTPPSCSPLMQPLLTYSGWVDWVSPCGEDNTNTHQTASLPPEHTAEPHLPVAPARGRTIDCIPASGTFRKWWAPLRGLDPEILSAPSAGLLS